MLSSALASSVRVASSSLTRAFATVSEAVSPAAKKFVDLELKHGAYNYHPLPVVLQKGEGVHVWDVDGKRYMDFLAGYSAVNMGHCHPRIIRTMIEQAQTLTLTSRAFHNNILGPWEKFMCDFFKYPRVLPMNTGVEGGETAVKLARRWAYDVKGVSDNKAKVLFARGNFWGRTIAACSSSEDIDRYYHFGPFTPGFELVPYNDLQALEEALKDPNVAAYMVEPIQGEAGVYIPQAGYLRECQRLCKKYNVLLIFDEVQVGLGRTGKMLCGDWEDVHPDILILGKALSGGVMPASAVLTNDEVMLTIKPNQHGSTFGGNPLACRVSMEALSVLVEEGMVENSQKMGELFRAELRKIDSPRVKEVRGKGLMNAIVIENDKTDKKNPMNAWKVCLALRDKGLLCKPTHSDIVRLTPPLCVNEEQIKLAASLIKDVIEKW